MNPRRLKAVSLIAGVASSGLTLVAWTQNWLVVTLASGQIDGAAVQIGGDVAAGGLAALGLAGLALVGALAIAGPVFRVVLGALEVFIGATVTLSALLAVVEPVRASSSAITAATGVSGDDSIADLVSSVAMSFWPWFAILLGVAGMALGSTIVVTGRRWPGSSRKYQAVRFEQVTAGDQQGDGQQPEPSRFDAVADWDALSDGSDPTSR